MKERRAASRFGEDDNSERADRLLALRRLRELAELEESELAALAEAARRGALVSGDDFHQVLQQRTDLPCKLTRVEQALAALRRDAMTPAAALAYAGWMAASARGWRSTGGQSREPANDAGVASESIGGATSLG